MLLILTISVICIIFPSSSQTYPVFGTKRYHRSSNNVQQVPVPASLVSNPASYYNSVPKYYYEQPQTAYIPPPAYHENYPDENAYYYYPRQEYYGMPTYRGEYKPTPYYYAHGPSYSYYDDREVAANPLDDLHEEMLQEDERERQREMLPVGQESWFENSPVQQQDELTNNFLRNLIAYNRQIEAQQQQQQLLQQQQQEQMELEQRQHQEYQKDQPAIYDEYADYPASSEYEYGSEQPESVYNLRKHDTPELHRAKNSEVEDENERQLKSLALAGKQHHPLNNLQSNNQHWEPMAASRQHNQPQQVGYAEDDADTEYDDTWINWDRKRSAKDSEMKMFPQGDQYESIKAFTNRKPSLLVEKITSTKKLSSTSVVPSSASFESTAAMTSTTPKPNQNSKFSGQKEIVLPRPAVIVQQHLFPTQPPVGIMQAQPSDADDEGEQRTNQGGIRAKSNVYDTIKQLIDMQQKYEKNSSKLQKRFVSNEENLVHELDSLKRRSV